MNNTAIARRLLDHAAALEAGGDNLYRIRAYRRAAFAVMTYPRPLADVLAAGGRRALEDVPGVGDHLAYTIERGYPVRNYRSDVELTALDGGGTDIRWHGSFDAKVPGSGHVMQAVTRAMMARFAKRLVRYAERTG